MSGEWLNVEATYKCKQMLWQNLWLLLVRNHNVIREEEHLIHSILIFSHYWLLQKMLCPLDMKPSPWEISVQCLGAWEVSLKSEKNIFNYIRNLKPYRRLRLISEKFSNRGMLECIHSLLIFFLQSTSTAEHWKAPGGRENLAGLQHWPLSLGNTWTYGLRFPT